jgi:hypothetical protein
MTTTTSYAYVTRNVTPEFSRWMRNAFRSLVEYRNDGTIWASDDTFVPLACIGTIDEWVAKYAAACARARARVS